MMTVAVCIQPLLLSKIYLGVDESSKSLFAGIIFRSYGLIEEDANME